MSAETGTAPVQIIDDDAAVVEQPAPRESAPVPLPADRMLIMPHVFVYIFHSFHSCAEPLLVISKNNVSVHVPVVLARSSQYLTRCMADGLGTVAKPIQINGAEAVLTVLLQFIRLQLDHVGDEREVRMQEAVATCQLVPQLLLLANELEVAFVADRLRAYVIDAVLDHTTQEIAQTFHVPITVKTPATSAYVANPPLSRIYSQIAIIRLPSPGLMASAVMVDEHVEMPNYVNASEFENRCLICQRPFGLLLGKHHCRVCCHAFCLDHSNYFLVIPEDEKTEAERRMGIGAAQKWLNIGKNWINGHNTQASRVCYICHEKNTGDHGVMKRCFEICEFALPELVRLSELWPGPANECIDRLTSLQYLLSVEPTEPKNKRLLMRNARHLAGHSRLLVQLCRHMDWSDHDDVDMFFQLLSSEKTISCSDLRCDRNLCHAELSFDDGLELISEPEDRVVTNTVVS